jgi:hypothetical protein
MIRSLKALKIVSYACGPIKGLATFWLRDMEWVHSQHPNDLQAIVITLLYSAANFCNIVNGIILIQSVRKIRKFFAENGDNNMDVAALLRHSSCFVLYLVATLIYLIAFAISVFDQHKRFAIIYQWSTVLFNTITFMSNILLAYIFIDVFRDQMEADQAEAENEKLQDELDKA